MSTSMNDKSHIESTARELFAAEKQRLAVMPVTHTFPKLTRDDAHEIQAFNIKTRINEGERLTGYKLGLTSREAQEQFKVFQPDYGQLTDRMAVWSDGVIELSDLIQPKIEGEIALVLGKNLSGPGVTVTEALRAVDYATASLEIVDCRMREWRVGPVDLVADNGASARYVLSPVAISIRELDLASLGMAISQNGEVRGTGAGAATLGSPLHALAFLANELGKKGISLKEGQVVLTGALSAMLKIAPGDYFTCEIQKLGRAAVRFAKSEALT